jgi:dTDP-glucose 4,6-dehydratase
VASGEQRAIIDIARDVVGLMNYRADQIQFIEDRPGQVVRHTGDWSKIHRVLGWKPSLGWHEGLKRTADWYEQNRELGSHQVFMRQIPIVTASGRMVCH